MPALKGRNESGMRCNGSKLIPLLPLTLIWPVSKENTRKSSRVKAAMADENGAGLSLRFFAPNLFFLNEQVAKDNLIPCAIGNVFSKHQCKRVRSYKLTRRRRRRHTPS
jgi:hypothetical protein